MSNSRPLRYFSDTFKPESWIICLFILYLSSSFQSLLQINKLCMSGKRLNSCQFRNYCVDNWSHRAPWGAIMWNVFHEVNSQPLAKYIEQVTSKVMRTKCSLIYACMHSCTHAKITHTNTYLINSELHTILARPSFWGVAFLLFVLACLDEPRPLLMYIIYHYLYPDGILIVLLQCFRRTIHQRHNRTPTFTGAHVNTGLMTFPSNQSEFAVFIWNLLALCCDRSVSQHALMKLKISQQPNAHSVLMFIHKCIADLFESKLV